MTKQTISRAEQLEKFINRGARKAELYNFYKPHSDRKIRIEIIDLLLEEGFTLKKAKNERTLRGSQVEKLENRLG
ncbi:hypothetical protein [Bizionia myxarmorum]|uniref:Uncharacterized protein n=1 Tax=Bizionia myxarmorum TaxID=291186 RepID=A0A5D0RC21_9FLAO|nr:hypothetical protein [Bizionia myxarmorum]TYB78325.1 hypothetical protein ES674_00665 [Bizionia myxarmorum]